MASVATIGFLKAPGVMPVLRNYYENWSIRAFKLEHCGPNNYLSPNRRDFYKVLFIKQASGHYTLGTKTYTINSPTILFIPPTIITSWKSDTDYFTGYFCLFKKAFVDEHPSLKAVIDKYHLFTDADKHIIQLSESETPAIIQLFERLQQTDTTGGEFAHDTMQAYLQLMFIESIKKARFPQPDAITDDYKHIHHFFQLLEKETANINYINPVRIKTAKEFADDLGLSPNYLSALLKKTTGQNVSAHIKSRLLDESKALLLQTDWTLQDIGYAIGFADQPNFSAFFKKSTGFTPAEFRKK
jgi:AraC family transcriptional activator of pobA